MTPQHECLVECEQIGDDFLSPPSYVFQSQSFMVSFVVIQEEMEQLHDYCLLCLEAIDKKFSSLNKDLSDYRSGKKFAEAPEIGDVTGLMIDGLVHLEIPRWSDTQGFLVKAMCLLLLSSFLERSLKSLSCDFSPSRAEPNIPKTSRGKAADYIHYLQEDCGLSFDEPESSMAVRKNCQRIRNDFAHGDWDAVRQRITGQSLRAAFDAYSILLREIEAAYLALQ